MFRKKKEEFKPTEPTEEMVKAIEFDSDMDDSEDEEVPEIEPKKVSRRKPVYEKEEMTKEELEEEQVRLENKIKELNEREKELRPKERIQVVKEIPMIPLREYKAEDGSTVHLMTIEEYLTEQANSE